MITVCLWKYGNKYDAGYVNRMASMVRRHLPIEHRIVCITDDPYGLDPLIDVFPIKYDGGQLNLRRLWIFSKDAMVLGSRLFQLDLDLVITGDLTPLVTRPEPFIIYKYQAANSLGYALNPSVMLMDAGAYSWVWEDYLREPIMLFNTARRARCSGSDQSIITYSFTQPIDPRNRARTITCPVWTEQDGIYWYKIFLGRRGSGDVPLPPTARIVSFHGSADPKHYVDKWPWVKEMWR